MSAVSADTDEGLATDEFVITVKKGTCDVTQARVTRPQVSAPTLLEFELYEESTIEFNGSTIFPLPECGELVVTYVLCDETTGDEIDESIYEIDDTTTPGVIKIEVNDKSYVERFTPTDPLKLVLKAILGPEDAPYDEKASDPFEITFKDPCDSTVISLVQPIPVLEATVFGDP